MIKVALLHFCFEDYTVELANSLHQLVDLTLIQPKTVASVCQNGLNPDVKIRTFDKPRIRDLRNVKAMRDMLRIIHELQPDILHVQETNDPWYDFTVGLNRLPPLVTTIHDVMRHPGDRDLVPGSDYTRRINFFRSHQLLVHTETMKQAFIQRFPQLLQRVSVVPHGELGSLYQRRSQTVVPNREPYTILFFGRIWPYKGLKYLLEALPLIAAQIPEVKVIIAGRGEEIHQYLPAGFDDANRFQILNRFIPPEEVVHLFQRSTIIVLPYIEASQSGVAALAYGLGTPVIASDVGGLGDLIHHGKDGWLVPARNVQALADAIIHLLRDRTLQHQLQAAMVERCQQDLNWFNIADRTVEVYQKILATQVSNPAKL